MNLLQNPLYYFRCLLDLSKEEDAKVAFRGMFSLLRTVFLDLLSEETISLSSHLARTIHCYQKYAISSELMSELEGFRVLDKGLEQGSREVCAEHVEAAIFVCCRTISFFSGAQIPRDLAALYEGRNLLKMKSVAELPDELDLVKAVVLKIAKSGKLDNGIDYLQLICMDQETGAKLQIVLSDIAVQSNRGGATRSSPHFIGGHLCKIGRLLWRFARVNFMNLQRVGEQGNYYQSTERSMMVIEPDYLVDATTIASCFQFDSSLGHVVANPLMYLLGRFAPGDSTAAMLLGTMTNDFLDRLLDDPDVDSNKVFWDVLMKHALTAVMLGPKEMADIRQKVMSIHHPHLKEVARYYRQQKTWIEPTFLSAKFGLQGRLDVLVEDKEDAMRKDIFELKSGKPPKSDVWESHKIQVVCYNLLLSSTYEQERKGKSAIFYSYLPTNSLRQVKATLQSAQNVLMLRNLIVLINRRLEKGDFSSLSKINLRQFGTFPIFLKERIQQFEQTMKAADPLVMIYFETFTSFVQKELKSAKTGTENPQKNQFGFSAVWRMSLKEKLEAHKVLQDLRFNEQASNRLGEGLIQFDRQAEEISDYRSGDIILFYPQDEQRLRPLNYQIVKGTLVEVHKDRVLLRLRNTQLSFDHFKKYERWIVEHDFMESGFRILTQNLFDFVAADQSSQQLALGVKAPSNKALPANIERLGSEDFLTDDQKHHLKRALEARDYYLLQGPPGTGKTSAIILKMVQHYLQESEEVITLLAFTNRAVDEIADKLKRNDIEYIRLGGSNNADSQILRNLIQGKNLNELTDLLKGNRVFVSTISSFLSRKPTLKHITRFDLLIVDEASQLLEPHLIGILPYFRKYVLIGDQNQLPAVCSLKESLCQTERKELHEIGIKDLRVSLFERLFKKAEEAGWDHAYGTLKHHFRMHDDIADLVNPYYDHKLESYTGRQKENLKPIVNLEGLAAEVLGTCRLSFVAVPQQESYKSCPREALIVAELIRAIQGHYGADFDAQKVGVMTPWRAQISEIKKAIGEESILSKVSVDTIERYQGSEKEIIIISTAIFSAGQLKMLQSLNEEGKVDRKLNVAISRARERLIIIGNPANLSDVHYLKLIANIKEQGQYLHFSDIPQHSLE